MVRAFLRLLAGALLTLLALELVLRLLPVSTATLTGYYIDPLILTYPPRHRFTLFNVAGALIWVLGVVSAGYLFGNLPWVQANLSKIIWALILVPGLIALYGGWKAGRAAPSA